MSEKRYAGPERRKFPRIPFWYIVKYKVHTPVKGEKIEKPKHLASKSKDISLGGILLETNHHYPVSTVLEIEIDVPVDLNNHVYAEILGRVLRSTTLVNDKVFDTAVEFISVPEKHRKSILRLINAFM